jgi:hemolysin-activating ACP:hemolysin acyltransferase
MTMPLWSKGSKNKQTESRKVASTPEKPAAKPPAGPSQQSGLSAQDLAKRREISTRLLMRFGEVVSVLMRARQFRDMPLKQLEVLVVPPLTSGQFLVAEAQSKAQGFVTPVAAVLWAKVSKEVDHRLSQNLDKPPELAPKDWNSGEIGWLIVLAGTVQALAPLLKQLQDTTFKGHPVKMRARDRDGEMVVTTVLGAAKAKS